MKTKKFNLLFASVFAFVFLMGLVSATITLTPSISTLSQTSGSFEVAVSSDQNETIDLTMPSISDGSGRDIVFSLSSDQITLNTVTGDSEVISVDYVVDSGFNFELGEDYSTTLTATGEVSDESTREFTFESSDFCEYNNEGELRVTIKDVAVTEGFGEDNDWYAFDTIEIEVEIKNSGDEDIQDISIEWGLYNTQSKDWTIEIDEEDEMDIDSGDKETVIITFTLDDSMDEDLEDLEEGTYVFYVRATGEIADGTYEGDNTCASDSEEGELTLEKDFVILTNLDAPEVAQCDSEVRISGDVWNIGSKDQNDIYLKIYNKELGINEEIDIGDLDSFESTDFDFMLQLPEDAQEKNYYLTLEVYDEDDDIYESGDDDASSEILTLNVEGNCAVAKASLTAALESGGEAGKEMVVMAIVSNTGKTTSYYSLNVAGYSGWASLASIDQDSFTLNAGESKEVLITFDVNKDALGANLFTLELVSENEIIISQPVQVEITKKESSFFLRNLFSGDNKYIWGIGILNIVLIVLIIIIAVRIARK